MITSKQIKDLAYELGAAVCGIGSLDLFEGAPIQRDPKMILPAAKCIIGFGFRVPRMMYETMARGVQFYPYTSVGVQYTDEQMSEIFLLKLCSLIENDGWDACPQRTVPNLKAKGDTSANPEVVDVYELIHAVPVEEGKPAPDVMIDFGIAAQACGIGVRGKSGSILSPKNGPFMRWAFIITDAPLECDKPFTGSFCDGCDECSGACKGHAIGKDGLDSWQCAVYYRGAHKSNPYMTDEVLKDEPDREAILNGEKRFDRESARNVMKQLNFMPPEVGYVPCLCGRACDVACYKKLKKEGKING